MGRKILIVDDEAMVRSLLRSTMEQHGYAVEEAADGGEAIRLLEGRAFDLVISDILMPDTDGLELIMFLRKRRPDTPVIAMSAPHNALFLNSARVLGARNILEKPFRMGELIDTVQRALDALPSPGAV